MKFKSRAITKVSQGVTFDEAKIVIPNQSMSLEEILTRFTRGETLAVAQPVNYHESEDDLEKVSQMDLVDKEEYVEKLKQTQKAYKDQESKKAAKERARLEKIAIEKIEAEKRKNEPPVQQSAK